MTNAPKRGFISPLDFKNLEISDSKLTTPSTLFNASLSSFDIPPKKTLIQKENPQALMYQKLAQKYQDIIDKGLSEPNIEPLVNEIRKLILLEGLPPPRYDKPKENGLSIRAMVWKILVGVQDLDIKEYLDLVERGPCPKIYDEKRKATLYDKIRNDTHRTFRTDQTYHDVVPEETLIRVLNAFCNSGDPPPEKTERPRKNSLLSQVHKLRSNSGSTKKSNTVLGKNNPPNTSLSLNDYQPWYVQGMNCIAGVFLYLMPELDAFYCFKKLASTYCPLYYCQSIEGAYTGTALAEEVLKLVDEELYKQLNSLLKKQADSLGANPQTISSQLTQPILSLGADSKPLDQVLKLWDFFLAFGIHLNVIITVARLVSIRDVYMGKDHLPTSSIDREFGKTNLNADQIITMAISFVRQIPNSLYKKIVEHPFIKQSGTGYSSLTLHKDFKVKSESSKYSTLSTLNISKSQNDFI